ncbi:MAG: glutamate--cysteine ligase [Ignavibacteriales bacterium]|jgi:gamma-glutamyl:cysteine ligase YbdK (ATP-grasp superfamily)|nr:MAG: glutamate--cysteine ligase [Ignavibacteriales bacterium]
MIESLGLFQGFGVELEYMIVDNDTLRVNPITDEVIKEVTGEYISDYEDEEIGWSNEIVLHVIELKTNGPAKLLNKLSDKFSQNVKRINKILEKYNSVLLPSGAHPFYHPDTETKLWPHDNNTVYEAYNKIFDCRGHGWSNLQSTHINLPFADDNEFGKLHAAIRLLLPIIPAIAASTPILDSKNTGFLDARLEVYRKNQIRIPSITGKVIPEQVFTREDYEEKIFNRIYQDIAAYDENGILQNEWLNSRGAIARFDRNTIEIRVVDIQECPKTDLALVGLFSFVLKELIGENNISYNEQKSIHENELSEILLSTIKTGENSIITNRKYLRAFGINKNKCSAKELWQHIFSNIVFDDSILSKNQFRPIETILNHGSLATRILNSIKNDFSHDNIVHVYKQLRNSLITNEMFVP